ncbi:hypothetical protein LEMLEM_LOCUS10145 [Lemmus lemmus]
MWIRFHPPPPEKNKRFSACFWKSALAGDRREGRQ